MKATLNVLSKRHVLTGADGFEEFADRVRLPADERAGRRAALEASFMPFKVTDSYADLVAAQPDEWRRQMTNVVLPPVGPRPFVGRFDPYGNTSYRQESRRFLQHKYGPTLLLHVDDFCVANCQFCYKVNEIRHEPVRPVGLDEKVDQTLAYLDGHPEVNNVLFTGGDPAAFRSAADLTRLIGRLLAHPHIRVVRFATKGLAYEPRRFLDGELLSFFAGVGATPGKQVSVIAQLNHPGEIGPEAVAALRALREVGVQVRGQPAVVRGVNDSADTLTALQQRFLDHRVISYYLTVFMPVRGVEQYALPLDEAFRAVAESRRRLSGLEKKGVLLASHDFGKFEICGFLPSPERPRRIVLKWHQAARRDYLPSRLLAAGPCRPDDLLVLEYSPDCYCVDHVFRLNGLPHFDSENRLVGGDGADA